MHSELLNLSLFAQAIAKVALLNLPVLVLLPWMKTFGVKFFCPVAIGKEYKVSGYHTGTFIGRCDQADRDIAKFTVLDSLRPIPKVRNRCPFPGCVLKDFHAGNDHELLRVRVGGQVEVFWRQAKFEDLEKEAA